MDLVKIFFCTWIFYKERPTKEFIGGGALLQFASAVQNELMKVWRGEGLLQKFLF